MITLPDFYQSRIMWSIHHIKTAIVLAIILCAGCASGPEIKPAVHLPTAHPPSVDYALSLQGIRYQYGKDSPQEGFDCSGFVKHVYQRQGIKLPRTTTEMAQSLLEVPKHDVHSGDLVFFNTNGKPFSHVGIYVNNDDFIHAPSQRTGKVLVSSLKNQYWKKHFTGVRRP